MSKIRGWKRRKRMLNEWASRHDRYDSNRLLAIDHESAKLFTYPEIEAYPIWFKKSVLDKLLEVKSKWALRAQKEISGRYLLLVLVDLQDILHSEVILVMEESIELYKQIYPTEPNHEKIPLWVKEHDHFDQFQAFKKTYILDEDDLAHLSKEERDKLDIIAEKEDFNIFEEKEEKWYTIEKGTILIWYEESN